MLLAVASVVSGTSALHSQPEAHNGHYYLHNHGSLTPVSRTTYLRASAAGQRLFMGFAAVAYALSAIISKPRATGEEPEHAPPAAA